MYICMCIYTYIHIYHTLILASSHLSSTHLPVCQAERSRRAKDMYTLVFDSSIYTHLSIYTPTLKTLVFDFVCLPLVYICTVYIYSSSTRLSIHTCLHIHSPSKHSSSTCLSSTRLYIHCIYTLVFDLSVFDSSVYTLYTYTRLRLVYECVLIFAVPKIFGGSNMGLHLSFFPLHVRVSFPRLFSVGLFSGIKKYTCMRQV